MFDFLADPNLSHAEKDALLRGHFQRVLDRPNANPETSEDVYRRAKRLSSMATGALMLGKEVNPQYDPISYKEQPNESQ